jgi:hypothetical protein
MSGGNTNIELPPLPGHVYYRKNVMEEFSDMNLSDLLPHLGSYVREVARATENMPTVARLDRIFGARTAFCIALDSLPETSHAVLKQLGMEVQSIIYHYGKTRTDQRHQHAQFPKFIQKDLARQPSHDILLKMHEVAVRVMRTSRMVTLAVCLLAVLHMNLGTRRKPSSDLNDSAGISPILHMLLTDTGVFGKYPPFILSPYPRDWLWNLVVIL